MEQQKKEGLNFDGDDSEEVEVEQASDDEDIAATVKRPRGRRRRIDDSDYAGEADAIEEDDEEDARMDDLEPEQIDTVDQKAAAKKKQATPHSRRHRTEVEEADLAGEEQEETVFIDNLPNEEQDIRSMLI